MPTLRARSLVTTLFFLVFMFGASAHTESNRFVAVYNDLLKQAQETSPDLIAAKKMRDLSGYSKYSSFTRWLPRLDGQLSQSKSKDFSILNSGSFGSFNITPIETELRGWQLSANWPLYKKSILLQWSDASLEREIQSLQSHLKQTELTLRIKRLYGDFLAEVFQQQNVKTSVLTSEKTFKETQLRFDSGSRTKIDVLRAEAQWLNLLAREKAAENRVLAAQQALYQYVGPSEEIDRLFKSLSLEDPNRSKDLETDLIGALDTIYSGQKTQTEYVSPLLSLKSEESTHLLENTLLPQSARFRLIGIQNEKKQNAAEASLQNEYPELLARATWNKQADQWSKIFEPEKVSYSVGLVLNVPLFSFGSTYSGFKESTLQKSVSEVEKSVALQKLRDEVQLLIRQLKSQEGLIKALKRSVDQNVEIERLSQKSYELGKSTSLELLQAQNAVLDSKSIYFKSKVDQAVLSEQLQWSLGWMQ
jgi:outer membrane protein TolC